MLEKIPPPVNVEKSEILHNSVGLKDRLDSLVQRAELLKVEVHGLVETSEGTMSIYPDEPIFGASLAKLPLANMVIDNLFAQEELRVERHHVVPYGSGEYDLLRKSKTATVGELLDDMLRRSGNTPFRVFAEKLGGGRALNDYYHDHEWRLTRVNTLNGNVMMGSTSPREVLSQLRMLMNRSDVNPLAAIAHDSLRNSLVDKTGIRQRLPSDARVCVYNKTGEYNGDTDAKNPVPYAVRHDVGRIEGPDGIVDYVFMTKSPMPSRGLVANAFVGQLGAELVRYAGGKPTTLIGSLALRATN